MSGSSVPSIGVTTRAAVVLLASCADLKPPPSASYTALARLASNVGHAPEYDAFLVVDDHLCPGLCERLAPPLSFHCVERSAVGDAIFFARDLPGYPFDASPYAVDYGVADGLSGPPWWFRTFWTWEHGLHKLFGEANEIRTPSLPISSEDPMDPSITRAASRSLGA